jgi:hypothetical protein
MYDYFVIILHINFLCNLTFLVILHNLILFIGIIKNEGCN